MLFENLAVKRIAMHEIFRRNDKAPQQPVYADGLEALPQKALDQFHLRVTEALSAQSKSMEMRLVRVSDEDMVGIAEGLLDSSDADFLVSSRLVTDKLAEAQLSRGVPGGVVVVFDGTVGAASRPFVAAIKAEVQSGFRRRQTAAKKTVAEFLDDIFLTPAQRLYKIGVLVKVKDVASRSKAWTVHVFDSNLSTTNREAAAQYFYEAFMGCTFPENGAYETARFFDLAREFVRRTELKPDKKRDLVDALFTFVKTNQAPTFTANEFATDYLPTSLQDDFKQHLDTHKFPDRAVVRDLSDMGTRLRRRQFRFGSDVTLSTSPEAITDKRVLLKSLPASQLGGFGDDLWTQIVIKQAMTDQT